MHFIILKAAGAVCHVAAAASVVAAAVIMQFGFARKGSDCLGGGSVGCGGTKGAKCIQNEFCVAGNLCSLEFPCLE